MNYLANAPIQQEGGSGGDDSPSSHDSGLGGNITAMGINNTNVNCEGGIAVDSVNCIARTDSATPPSSNSNNAIDVALRGMEQNTEDIHENYKPIECQRINNSSPLSCPSSPISSVSAGIIHSSAPKPFNNSTSVSCSFRGIPIQYTNARQTPHISQSSTNVAGICHSQYLFTPT